MNLLGLKINKPSYYKCLAAEAEEQEIESVYRPEIDMYYRYFYSRFIVHLFNSKTVDFNLKPNFDLFMMQNAVGQKEDIGAAMHDKFVEKCFFLFQYEYEKNK